MSAVSRVKDIDNSTKYKIFGYVREHEKQTLMVIPILAQYIIMLYYWMNEKFTKHGSKLELNENSKLIISRPMDEIEANGVYVLEYNSAYGNIIIMNDESISKYKWSIRYSFCDTDDPDFATFGIASEHSLVDQLFSWDELDIMDDKYRYYSVCSDHAVLWNHDSGDNEVLSGSGTFGKKGIIHLSLDITQNKLTFSLGENLTEYTIATNVDLENNKFRLAIAMILRQGNECELIGFETFQK